MFRPFMYVWSLFKVSKIDKIIAIDILNKLANLNQNKLFIF